MLFQFPKIRAAKQDMPLELAGAPCLQILRGYWEGLRTSGALPQRTVISPNGLGGAIEHCFIIERIAQGVGRFRVAGSKVGDILGIEPRGMPVTLLLEPVARAMLTRVLDDVFTTATALDITLEAERAIGRPQLHARMILLPIADPNGAYHHAIGALALTGDVGRAPRRFSITRLHREVLQAPSASEGAIKSAVTPLLAGAANGALAHPLTLSAHLPEISPRALPSAHGHLRLVHSRVDAE